MIRKVIKLVDKVSANLLGTKFEYLVSHDVKFGSRIFIQIMYKAECSNSGEVQNWKGRKYYLSSHMTDDEVIKTCFVAFKSAIDHEVMEGFKVKNKDGVPTVLFNPHVNYEELLAISHKEVSRT